MIIGVKNAIFSSVRNSAEDSKAFAIVVRTGVSWSWHCFNSHVEIGSTLKI